MRRTLILVVTGLTFAVGCPKAEDEGEDNPQGSGGPPSGALECDTTPVECRSAFADTYEGTYASAKTGRVILEIDALGGIVGSVTKTGSSVALFGQVDQYGQVTFTDDDMTEWKGQFTEQHALTGTWTAMDGTSGVFTAVSSTMPAQGVPSAMPSSGSSTPSTPSTPSEGSAEMSDAPASEAVDAALSACMATLGCDGAPTDCSEIEATGEAGTLPQECRAQELALYECIEGNGCDFAMACDAIATEAYTCAFGG